MAKKTNTDIKEKQEKDLKIILDDKIEVEIIGKKFYMRRLNTRDVFTFAKILSEIIKYVPDNAREDETIFLESLIIAMAEHNDKAIEFYASLVGLDVEEFYNQPPEFISEFFEVLKQHYDLQSFFIAVLKTVQSMVSLWQN